MCIIPKAVIPGFRIRLWEVLFKEHTRIYPQTFHPTLAPMMEHGSSKPPTLEWKASVASNLHQMVFEGVLHQLWIYSISLDLHPKVSMMWSLYNHNLKVQVHHNCSTRCHWIISSFISYESMKQNIKYHCTKWYIIELWSRIIFVKILCYSEQHKM